LSEKELRSAFAGITDVTTGTAGCVGSIATVAPRRGSERPKLGDGLATSHIEPRTESFTPAVGYGATKVGAATELKKSGESWRRERQMGEA
jgi:hypothetical protein